MHGADARAREQAHDVRGPPRDAEGFWTIAPAAGWSTAMSANLCVGIAARSRGTPVASRRPMIWLVAVSIVMSRGSPSVCVHTRLPSVLASTRIGSRTLVFVMNVRVAMSMTAMPSPDVTPGD